MTFWARFVIALMGAACIGLHAGSMLVFMGVFWLVMAVAPKD